MVFQAIDAAVLTSNTIQANDNADVQLEVTLAENKVRAGAGVGLSQVLYNATIVGNPKGNPNVQSNLTVNQLSFYSDFIDAGYTMGVDNTTGWWSITWAPAGAETEIAVYTFRTTFAPGAIVSNTKTIIENYFASLLPVVHTQVTFNNFIDEVGFGGVSSTYYEFTIAAAQDADETDHSAALKTAIVAEGIGYLSGNCAVYKLI